MSTLLERESAAPEAGTAIPFKVDKHGAQGVPLTPPHAK
jgi:hypothetical protein